MQRIAEVTDAVLTSIINAKRLLNSEIDYHSAAWTRISFAIKLRDGFKCRQCKSGINLRVHHIKPIDQGGLHLQQNLITLCDHCHKLRHRGKR